MQSVRGLKNKIKIILIIIIIIMDEVDGILIKCQLDNNNNNVLIECWE